MGHCSAAAAQGAVVMVEVGAGVMACSRAPLLVLQALVVAAPGWWW